MGNSRAWQVVAVLFLCIGLPQVVRGVVDGSTGELVVGLVSLGASASGFYEARAQRRKAQSQAGNRLRPGAAEAPPEHGRPR
ncbi:hypothetical protein KIH74_19990 [Kineosporia sp. J2-2]|uniref:Uncharacterized protein n=1 Tax=Kineosporia corallincola TaxID=2835133 RepID=A0ABS5TJI1_9ACTN|nr:hypothetical protein [Kineosporia corallincola]MBT0771231.1 hypothetical protein [Kineosporia corallincola]